MPITAAEPETPIAEPPQAVKEPTHPLHQLTTYELRNYRRELERALAFYESQAPVALARDRLQARLDEVIAEQDERARLAHA